MSFFVNGSYSICRGALPDEGDGLIYTTLAWGYDSEEEAIANARRVALENDVPIEEIVIVKCVFAGDLDKEGILPAASEPDLAEIHRYLSELQG